MTSLSAETYLDEGQVREILRTAIGKHTIAQWARDNGLVPQQVDSFLRSDRPVEPKLARVLGLRRVVFYQVITAP